MAPFLILAIRSPVQFNRLAELPLITGESLALIGHQCCHPPSLAAARAQQAKIAPAAITRGIGTEPPVSHLQVEIF
ncbi:hypothetical protein Rhsp01_46100 [Rhizobium sp. NBRC 114257]|uniref:Uncharacterized protein n=1 Tax=Rhizobium dioscoreae TaxID=2653122 RepID=A0ABQ0Z881_9HYPH|nr:hypothetical protein RsS93_43750 [Rhizobium dioscoreae]GLU83434.1 hypothetical protein Rhsp01_46100 [Rhizobium sp. NBRC 114257]